MATTIDTKTEQMIHEIALGDFKGPGKVAFDSNPLLARLSELGTELWLDTGDLEEARGVWHSEFNALTTNNTLVNKVVQTGIFDALVPDAAAKLRAAVPDISDEALVREIGFILNCRTALRLIEAFGVHVSVELHPAMAHNIEASVHYAKRYFSICPELFYVKVPLTPEGYCAVARLGAAGVPVNFTLGFSARQNYIAALFSQPSFVNVFLGRNNAVVSDNKLGDGKYVGEKACLATQRALIETRKAHPEIKTRLIAASLRNGGQMRDLAGVDLYTAPPKAAQEFIALEMAPESLVSQVNKHYPIELNEGLTEENTGLGALWEVTPDFMAFAEACCALGRTAATGDQLVRAANEAGISFLRRFSPGESETIKAYGKIPVLGKWSDVALDDLMTQSALQSFAVDQQALDDRIRSLAG